MPIKRLPAYGFTLIEILVVILIISISLTFTFLAFGDFGASRKAETEAEQFVSIVKLVQQHALLETKTYGFNLKKDGYGVVYFDEGKGWQQMSGSHLAWHAFPEKVVFVYKLTKNPQLIVNPAGEVSQFMVYFGTKKQPEQFTVIGKPNGEIVLRRNQKNA